MISNETRTARRGFALGATVGVVAGFTVAGAIYRQQLLSMFASYRPYERRSVRVDKPVLIINRWSGGGKAEKYDLVSVAARHGIEAVMLERGDDLADLAEQAVKRGADALGMAGGDGSLGIVSGVAAAHDLPFFCVPMGTRNHFALDLGLDRDDPLDALRAVDDGREIKIDLGEVGGRAFLNNVSFGLYPAAVKQDGYRDDRLGTFLATATAANEAAVSLRFTTPDGREHNRSPMVLISNNPYAMSGPPDYGRRIRLDSARLGIAAILPDGSNPGMLDLFKRSSYESWTESSMKLEAGSGTIDVGVDGESIPMSSPVEVTIRPRALRVLVPKGTRPGFIPRLGAGGAGLENLLNISG